jgi:hypothetical protein
VHSSDEGKNGTPCAIPFSQLDFVSVSVSIVGSVASREVLTSKSFDFASFDLRTLVPSALQIAEAFSNEVVTYQ